MRIIFFKELTVWNTATLWKFHDFSINQILREINFWDSRSAKSAIINTFRGSEC